MEIWHATQRVVFPYFEFIPIPYNVLTLYSCSSSSTEHIKRLHCPSVCFEPLLNPQPPLIHLQIARCCICNDSCFTKSRIELPRFFFICLTSDPISLPSSGPLAIQKGCIRLSSSVVNVGNHDSSSLTSHRGKLSYSVSNFCEPESSSLPLLLHNRQNMRFGLYMLSSLLLGLVLFLAASLDCDTLCKLTCLVEYFTH